MTIIIAKFFITMLVLSVIIIGIVKLCVNSTSLSKDSKIHLVVGSLILITIGSFVVMILSLLFDMRAI